NAKIIAHAALVTLVRGRAPQGFYVRRHAAARGAEVCVDQLPAPVAQDFAGRPVDCAPKQRMKLRACVVVSVDGQVALTMREVAEVVTIARVAMQVLECERATDNGQSLD